jgi:hypothetical protein
MRRSLIACALLLSGTLVAGCDDLGTLSDNANLNCDRIRSLSLGSGTSGSLDTGDCRLGDGSAVDYYRFRISSPRTVYISEQSGSIEPYVALLDEYGSVVAEEDNGGPGFSEISGIYLPEGTYYIAASSYAAGDYGSYTLDTDYN